MRQNYASIAAHLSDKSQLELSPDGASYRMRTRFHFQNMVELIKLFRSVADMQMAERYDTVQAAAAV